MASTIERMVTADRQWKEWEEKRRIRIVEAWEAGETIIGLAHLLKTGTDEIVGIVKPRRKRPRGDA